MRSTHATDEFSRAKRTAFHLLKVRSRSEKELTEKLKEKKFAEETVRQIVEYLQKMQLIDDRQFARDWVNSRLEKSFGFRRIIFELKQKGISEDIINEELERFQENYPEEEIVLTLTKTRMLKYKNIDKDTARRRVFEFLAHRGFNIEAIETAIRKI